MGNICVEQNKYAKAIKMYRMALDQIPDVHKGMRLRILQNIGTVFVKMGQYADAITSFEHIMEEKADFKTGNILNNSGALLGLSDFQPCLCRPMSTLIRMATITWRMAMARNFAVQYRVSNMIFYHKLAQFYEQIPYSGIFSLVQIFADLPPNPPEEIFVVLIFVLPG